MANRIMINKSVTLNGCIVEVLGRYGESRIPLAVLCNLSEFSARITVRYLGGALSGPEYVSMLKYNKDWSNGK